MMEEIAVTHSHTNHFFVLSLMHIINWREPYIHSSCDATDATERKKRNI